MFNLLSVDQLSVEDIDNIMNLAHKYRNPRPLDILTGKLLINFFFEESTRTRVSFEIAAKKMGADVVNITAKTSSIEKGEDFMSSIRTIMAYKPNFLVIRHPESGIVNLLNNMRGVINAGDGQREHPSQALGDLYTIIDKKGTTRGLKVAFCGDVANSRVAKSGIKLLRYLGAKTRIITAPFAHIPSDIDVFGDMARGLDGVDVVMSCRYKKEYTSECPESYKPYKITNHALKYAKSDAIVMHAGPVMWGVDIDPDVPNVVDEQVANCLYVRQALLETLNSNC